MTGSFIRVAMIGSRYLKWLALVPLTMYLLLKIPNQLCLTEVPEGACTENP
jgi:hypothetical protein